ncbi:bifunctional biotin--[acetyl-CoA-carboxylase] ligase/biotin operon repressor BirA [Luteimonas yindakuii]|uniref:bifunctional biotin--[acetyl-CoA-carboxylase] ligase/biotin operon repressor BirA n=1 Tax=Luteimonas yindakuii TaxID=2565782 RepID=UPI0010A4C65B|nr:bifunctional biotin--[acetyl-CoA-carboxylase] ligase/biotin operon repressor BirA [Luteimonas yindakuii]QCO67022.1 bifunctional biotin--[acetyl-CoA-carboxylase] ligase/biotin operon repressor BirA [Luteimonas yindakuii]
MSLERALLQRLAAGPVSGDVLAREYGLSRAAVWKRIEALRAAGLGIEARAGRGYTLAEPLDLLDADVIRDGLTADATALLGALGVAWTLDSTNSELLRQPLPARGAAVLLAERQTGGRGRRGRDWASPLATNLYLSVALGFDGGLARLGGLSLVAGVCVAEAVAALGVPARLKWPNDLVVEGSDGLQKLGGLLIEGGGEHAGPVRAVIGIGINVAMPAAAGAAIGQAWTDLRRLGVATPVRNTLAAGVISRLLPALDAFAREGLAPFLPRYSTFDALRDMAVDIHDGGRVTTGIALGIAADGALRVRTDAGERGLHAGEVSLRRRAHG